MADKQVDDQYKAVVAAAHERLKPRGYAKSGAKFRRAVDGNFVIVQFQRSVWGSAQSTKFTVNFAIVSRRLAEESGKDPERLFGDMHGHARGRIGHFRTPPEDFWWTLDAARGSDCALRELLPLLERGVAFFEANASDGALAALWEQSRDTGVAADGRVWLTLAVRSLTAG